MKADKTRSHLILKLLCNSHTLYVVYVTRNITDFIRCIFQVSDSVTLDLLTYADLELLRNRKAGVIGRPRGGQQTPALGAKRYLILIYTVEFDRSAPASLSLTSYLNPQPTNTVPKGNINPNTPYSP